MSANHSLVRVGDHKITGHKNEVEIWKIDEAGWKGSNPVVISSATITAVGAVKTTFEVHIYQVGHMIYLEFPVHLWAVPGAEPAYALVTNACIPAAYRPENTVFCPFRLLWGAVVQAGVLMITPAGTITFCHMAAAVTPMLSQPGSNMGWDHTVGAFYNLREEPI